MGYYLYERKEFYFDDVYYLELYSLSELSKKILKLKIEEIKNIINKEHDDENEIKYDTQRILLIVYIDFKIKSQNNLKILGQLINDFKR